MTDLRTRMADVADNLDYYAGKTDGGTYAGGLQDAAGQIREALGGAQDGGAEEAVRRVREVIAFVDACAVGIAPTKAAAYTDIADRLRAALAPQAGDGAR